MTTLDPSAVATMQGRELSRAVAQRLMGIDVLGEAACACYDGDWGVYGPVADDDSGNISRLVYAEYPDDPWAGPDFAELNYPQLFGYTRLALGVVPDFAEEHGPAFFAMVEKVQGLGWNVRMSWVSKWRVLLWKIDEQHGVEADTLPLAFARAADHLLQGAVMTQDELDRLDALHAAMTPGEWEDGGEASISTTFDHEANIYPPEAKPGEDQVGGPLAVVNARGDGREDNARGIVALHNSYPALSAALRAAWVERDNAMNTAKIATERAVYWMKYGETNDARLAEAEELLRRFAESRCDNFGASRNSHCVAWNEKHGDDPETRVVLCGRCRAAAFLARTEPAK